MDLRYLWLAILPFIGGFAQAWQQAVTGRMRGVAGLARETSAPASVAASLLVNFSVGTITILTAYLIAAVVRGGVVLDQFPTNPWLYLVGPMAIVFAGVGPVVVRRIGVVVLGLGMIAGQTVGALVIDLAMGARPSGTTSAAAVLTLLAVAIPAIAAARRSSRERAGSA